MRQTEGEGIGQSVPRLEDDRYLRGKGEFIADIRLASMRDLAFVRSPVAHARIRGVRKPPGAELTVFTAADLSGVQPIVAISALPGFKASVQPVLADGKVRHVGEPIAVCVAASRADAEDLAAAVEVEFDELPAVVDMRTAPSSEIRVHEHWDNNVFLETFVEVAPERFATSAPIVVRRRLRTARQCMSPMEGRGVVADLGSAAGATARSYLDADAAHRAHRTRRLPRPRKGGSASSRPMSAAASATRASCWPRKFAPAGSAANSAIPVRWIEDRREQLTGNANCREHDYDITAYAEADGRLLGIDAEAMVDAGAYSAYPFSACLEAAQVACILPGPYVMQAYRCRTLSAATNKPPILPYRGVARAGVCFAMEVTLDAVARAGGPRAA